MSLRNPTQLRLGMSGEFFNATYRIVGRAVLGVFEYGQLYYWNEFYLESAGGKPATLVFEETETGAVWRLFTMFNPATPLTAEEAAAKKPGNPVEFDGAYFHVTRVDHSRVYFVEGRTPEGIAVGKEARYFNADAGMRQIVVSWTGSEVEFYSGMSTSATIVASAFKLEGFAAWRFMASNGRSWWNKQILLPAVLGVALIAIPIGCFIDLSRARPAAVKTMGAPVSPLHVGMTGVLRADAYRIAGHEVVEVAEMGRRWQQHEFDLTGTDDSNVVTRLIYDASSGKPAWTICMPLQLDHHLTPVQAGAMLPGQSVNVDGRNAVIKELFRATVRSFDGEPTSKTGDITYGFAGPMTSPWTLRVRWNQTNITYEQCETVAEQDIKIAFALSNPR